MNNKSKEYRKRNSSVNKSIPRIKEKNDEMVGLQMEYTAIRDEVILLMNEQNTHISNLFVMGISLLGFGYTLDCPIFFLMSYLILLPFQILINNKEYMMARSGAYIRIYIEPKIPSLKWENIIHDVDREFNNRYKFSIDKFNIENRACDYGVFIFSLISLVSYTASSISIYKNPYNRLIIRVLPIQIIGIICCIIGTIISFKLCRKGACFDVIYKECCDIFERKK